jgi:hypothetical protein
MKYGRFELSSSLAAQNQRCVAHQKCVGTRLRLFAAWFSASASFG